MYNYEYILKFPSHVAFFLNPRRQVFAELPFLLPNHIFNFGVCGLTVFGLIVLEIHTF